MFKMNLTKVARCCLNYSKTVLSFLHKGESKYTGICDLNHMIFLTKKSFDLNHD